MEVLDLVCSELESITTDCPVGRRLMVLGAEHATIAGFDLFYFSVFIKCMHLTWETILKEEYTEEVKEAWACVFDYIMARIRDGFIIFEEEREHQTLLQQQQGDGGDAVAAEAEGARLGNGTVAH